MDALVRVALRNNLGLPAILERIEKASTQLYCPQSYEEKEYHLAQLLFFDTWMEIGLLLSLKKHFSCSQYEAKDAGLSLDIFMFQMDILQHLRSLKILKIY